MRLEILANGFRPLQKVLLQGVRARTPDGGIPGPMAVLTYKRELFGKYMAPAYQEGMIEATQWTRGEMELFAAFVSRLNRCKY